MAEIKSLQIIAKRWFQKTFGNTYHSVMIHVNGNSIYVPFTYGYGEQYKVTAMNALKENGYRVGDYVDFCDMIRNNGFEIQCIDVERKKDL